MDFNQYIIKTKFKHIPVLFHWTVLLFIPWYFYHHHNVWATLVAFVSYVFLIFAHEYGHAYFARRANLDVVDIKLYVLHGFCTYDTPDYEEDDVIIAWGGVVAQILLLIPFVFLSYLIHTFFKNLESLFLPIYVVFVHVNIFSIVFNLLPIRSLDGALAWKILPRLPALVAPYYGEARFRVNLLLNKRSTKKTAPAKQVTDEIIKRIQDK